MDSLTYDYYYPSCGDIEVLRRRSGTSAAPIGAISIDLDVAVGYQWHLSLPDPLFHKMGAQSPQESSATGDFYSLRTRQMMGLVEKIAKVDNSPLPGRRRFLATALPVFVFTIFFPAILFVIPKFIVDPWLHLPTFLNSSARVVVGLILSIPGILFTGWSIRAQRVFGRGTPMPLMATRKLVVQKPYQYSRNPLFFGLINLFFGISILMSSLSSLVMVSTFSVIIMLYVKFIEEKELEKRFSDEYLAYKKTTPFLIPTPTSFRRKK